MKATGGWSLPVHTAVASIQVVKVPNVNAVAKSLAPTVPAVEQQLVTYVKNCVRPGLEYFQQQLQTSLKVPLAALAARLFCPSKLKSVASSHLLQTPLLFLSSAHKLVDLKGE